MIVHQICSKKVQTIRSDAKVRDAARRMSDQRVGSLVVVGHGGPVEGVVTDRDIVLRCVARGRASDTTTVADVMTLGMVAIPEDTPVERALEVMAEREVRRLVITNGDGELVGVLALDDVLELLSEETDAIGRLLRGQVAV
jgi:CBS domain-containing protein